MTLKFWPKLLDDGVSRLEGGGVLREGRPGVVKFFFLFYASLFLLCFLRGQIRSWFETH